MNNKPATVDDIIKILQKVSDDGMGHFVVTCNDEYYLAKRWDAPDVNESEKTIDLGGYY